MEKLQENHEFTSKDVLGVFASLGFLLLVAMNVIGYASEEYEIKGANKEMVKLSLQLRTHGEDFNALKKTTDGQEMRGPASLEPQNVIQSLGLEGKISKDPWGNPYQYKIFERASKVYAVGIWSTGPNGSRELSEKDFLKAESGRVFRILHAGDDLAHIEIFN